MLVCWLFIFFMVFCYYINNKRFLIRFLSYFGRGVVLVVSVLWWLILLKFCWWLMVLFMLWILGLVSKRFIIFVFVWNCFWFFLFLRFWFNRELVVLVVLGWESVFVFILRRFLRKSLLSRFILKFFGLIFLILFLNLRSLVLKIWCILILWIY